MKKAHFLLDSEIAELRLKYKEKHNRSILIQGRSYFTAFYNLFSFKSCQSSSELD
jgi:hypothetical protein